MYAGHVHLPEGEFGMKLRDENEREVGDEYENRLADPIEAGKLASEVDVYKRGG
jgi:hypothetical protein